MDREGIHCNLTLLFSFAQAVACAEAGVTLISPFVGRIYDWYKKERRSERHSTGTRSRRASVTRIYNYYKKFGYRTQVMGRASAISNRSSVWRAAICSRSARNCSKELESAEALEREVDGEGPRERRTQIALEEKTFRWMHNEDAMATEKLAEGIRKFNSDAHRLQQFALARVAETIG